MMVRTFVVSFYVLLCSTFIANANSDPSIYDKLTNKVLDMYEDAGGTSNSSSRETAKDAGRMFLGDKQASDEAIKRIQQRTENDFGNYAKTGSENRSSAVIPQNQANSNTQLIAQAEIKSSSDVDNIQMKNGDKFTGEFLSKSLTVITTYGQVTVPRHVMKEVAMTGSQRNVETIITVGGDRFSGFLMEQSLPVKLAAGNQLNLRKEKVNKIDLHNLTDGEGLSVPDSIEMRNTDVFQAKITTPEFAIETSYGVLNFKNNDISLIEFEGDERVIAKITLSQNKGTFQGTLKTDEIILQTRAGQELTVYRDKFHKIEFGTNVSPVTAGEIPHVSFSTTASDLKISNDPVSGQYVLVARKAGGTSIPYSATIHVNGNLVGVFTGERLVSISNELRKGLNSVDLILEPIAGVNGNGAFLFKAGPRSGTSFSPELFYSTADLDVSKKRKIHIPYYVSDDGNNTKEGDIALFARPTFRDKNLALITTVSLDGETIATLTGPVNGLLIEGLKPNTVHKITFVTESIKKHSGQNSLKIEIGRIASVQNGNFQFASLLEFDNRQGWDLKGSKPEPETGKNQIIVEIPFSVQN